MSPFPIFFRMKLLLFSLFNCVFFFFFAISGPDIWLEYAQYSIGGMGLPGGIDKVRSIFERAMTAVGLHVTKGQMVWEAYREFENAIFSTLQVCLLISIICFYCWFMCVSGNSFMWKPISKTRQDRQVRYYMEF